MWAIEVQTLYDPMYNKYQNRQIPQVEVWLLRAVRKNNEITDQ